MNYYAPLMPFTGKPVSLPPESEEVAGFYAALLESDHAQDQVFNNNFFGDWLKVLKKHPPVCNSVTSPPLFSANHVIHSETASRSKSLSYVTSDHSTNTMKTRKRRKKRFLPLRGRS